VKKQEIFSYNVKDIITRLKSVLKISTDIELAKMLGTSSSVLTMWKVRNNMDFHLLVNLCIQHQIDIHYIIIGDFIEEIRHNEQVKLSDEFTQKDVILMLREVVNSQSQLIRSLCQENTKLSSKEEALKGNIIKRTA